MHVYSADSRSRAYAVIVTLAVLVALAANGVLHALRWNLDWIASAPTVAAAFGLLYELTDAWAWRLRVLHRIGVIQTPVIDGTWEGRLVSSWNNAEVPVKLRIDQRWTHLVIAFEVAGRTTSTSLSVAASLHEAGHEHARLTYTYKNQIRPGVADDDMHDHDGTADLDFDLGAGIASGRYFNARSRQGTLELTKSRSERAGTSLTSRGSRGG